MCRKGRLCPLLAQRLWTHYRQTKSPRLALNWHGLNVHAAAGGPGCARIDRRDLVPARGKLDQRRHGELRRAHENQAERHGGLALDDRLKWIYDSQIDTAEPVYIACGERKAA